MRMRFKSLLGLIVIMFVICIFVGVGYLFYSEITNEADIVVDGEITINYLSGKNFKLNGNAEVEFSVTNNDTKEKYYYIQLTDVYASDVSYELTSSNNMEINNVLKSDIISNQIVINGNETINYKIKFKSKDNEEYSGTLQVGLKTNEENTFADVILKNNHVNDISLSNTGINAIEDEGLLKTDDDLGVAYYFRGSTKNNNLYFANRNWKIVKINGDGSVKVVLDGLIDNISKYYDEGIEFEGSTVDDALTSWYNNNLNDYSNYIAYYKYCNDYVLESGGLQYIAYNRIVTNKIPTYVCLGTQVNAKIGLLTADEVMLAGGSTTDNTSYYLYNENIKNPYFTMTSGVNNNGVYNPFVVTNKGALVTNVSGNLIRGVRPVINIIKNAKVAGDGTSTNPYTIEKN